MNTLKGLKDDIHVTFLPVLAWMFIHILKNSLRLRIIGEEKIQALIKNRQRLVYAAWHGRQFILVPCLSSKRLCVMSSTSRDGRMQANILKKFHFEIIPGSSKKSPIRALIKNIRKMQAGHDTIIAVDGPTGPIYKVKPGALFMAKKTNAMIIPLAFSADPCIILKAWDRYLLPVPFAKAVLIYGKPFKPSSDLSDSVIQKESVKLEKILNNLMDKANRIVQFH